MSRRLHTTLILPDVHVPFHNVKLVNKVLKLARDIRPDRLITSGDFLDCYSISRHNKGSLEKLRHITLDYEYQEGLRLIQDLNWACSSASRKDYLYGNHCDSFNRFKQDGDNGKVGKALMRPEEALRLRETDWKVHGCQPDGWKQAFVMVGKYLEVIHGNRTGTNPAMQHLQQCEGSVVCGHSHRFSSYVTGKHGGYNIGWLGDKDNQGFHYMARGDRRRWCNGFAVVYTLDDGSFRMCPVQCWNSTFVFAGKLY